MVRLPVLVWEVGGRKSDVLLRVVGEEDRQQPEHDVGHPHGSEQGGLWHGHSQNLPQGRVRLRTAADIPVSPGLPKPNILSELQSLGIPRILNFLKPKAPALTFLSERGRAASMLMALCHGKCRGGLERSGVLEAPPVPPGPPALPRKGQGYAGTARAGWWENLPQGRVRLRTAADIPVSPGLPKPNILSELQSLGIPRILNFLKPKAPALTFLSERGRAASMLMALCHGKCRGGLERSGVLEAPPVPPGPPATVCYLPRKRASRVSWARCTPRDTWTP